MKLKITTIIVLFFTCFIFSQNRPQEPKAPFNYMVEEVIFTNTKAENIKLAGTLTIPKNIKKPTVAILINGTGPHDRDCSIMGHKPFLVIADYLTNNGIAVLRFDERGTAKSEGDFSKATTYDLALDVEAAVTYLKTRKDINRKKIGLIGHSEGGIIAPLVASRNKNIAFAILMAGPGVSGDKMLRVQNEKILPSIVPNEEVVKILLDLNENFYRIVLEEKNDVIGEKIDAFLDDYLIKNKDNELLPYIINDASKSQYQVYAKPSMRELVRFNPKPFLLKTKCPVLAINGDKDVQVISKLNLSAIESNLKMANNKDVTIKEFESLNHLFQTAETGMVSEYGTIEETISPQVLETIKDWILKRF